MLLTALSLWRRRPSLAFALPKKKMENSYGLLDYRYWITFPSILIFFDEFLGLTNRSAQELVIDVNAYFLLKYSYKLL